MNINVKPYRNHSKKNKDYNSLKVAVVESVHTKTETVSTHTYVGHFRL